MSIVVVSVSDGHALLACDGVVTEMGNGSVIGFCSKIILMPELEAMIGQTGNEHLGTFFRLCIPRTVRTFDDLVPLAVDTGREAQALMQRILDGYEEADSSITIAGWSAEAQAYRAYRIFNYPKETKSMATGRLSTYQPWDLIEVQPGGFVASTMPTAKHLDEFGLLAGIDEDVICTATRLVCAARSTASDSSKLCPTPNIGGYVQVAILEGRRAHSWIAHDWPEDVIGRPVDASTGEALPDWLVPTRASA